MKKKRILPNSGVRIEPWDHGPGQDPGWRGPGRPQEAAGRGKSMHD